MAYRYLILSEAQDEYESSVIWYNERSWLAADQFIEAVDNALGLICEHPYRWRNEYSMYYELGVKKYPFSIIYRVDEEKQLVVVTSVYHQSRNPKKKYKK